MRTREKARLSSVSDMIRSLRFLHAFAADISQPIARDGRE
jgi:hypothetical protein